MAKKKYYIRLEDFSFYDSSPYTSIPNTDTYSFKSARNREKWKDEFTKDIEGLLSHSVIQWRAR